MKTSFLKSTLLTIVLSASSIAQAGLIIGNQEYMDLSLTKSKTNAQIEAVIASNGALSGYTLATDVDAAYLYSFILGTGHNDSGWHALDFNTMSTTSQDVAKFFMNSYTENLGSTDRYTDVHGVDFDISKISQGVLRYKDKNNGNDKAGYFQIASDLGVATGLFQYDTNDRNNIANLDRFLGNLSGYGSRDYHSLYVRSVDVPEPSSLAILALGLIGLSVRRNKRV